MPTAKPCSSFFFKALLVLLCLAYLSPTVSATTTAFVWHLRPSAILEQEATAMMTMLESFVRVVASGEHRLEWKANEFQADDQLQIKTFTAVDGGATISEECFFAKEYCDDDDLCAVSILVEKPSVLMIELVAFHGQQRIPVAILALEDDDSGGISSSSASLLKATEEIRFSTRDNDDERRRLLLDKCPILKPFKHCPGANDVPHCPPTYNQSSIDSRFVDSSACSYSCSGEPRRCCDLFHKGASACTRSLPTHYLGPGQQCCYDDNFALITDFYQGAGTFDCVTPVGNVESTLKHWVLDVLPFLLCCTLLGMDTAHCTTYSRERPSDDGSQYQAPL